MIHPQFSASPETADSQRKLAALAQATHGLVGEFPLCGFYNVGKVSKVLWGELFGVSFAKSERYEILMSRFGGTGQTVDYSANVD